MAFDPVPGSAHAQKQQFRAAYKVLETAVADRAFPGTAFGVLSRGSVVALDGVGHFIYPADAAQFPQLASKHVSPATIYDLASVTKVVATTAAAMLLYDRGILDLDEPVGDILPGFVIGTAQHSAGKKTRVTLRMLLAHSSGLPAYAPLYKTCGTAPELVRACLRLPLEAPPSTRVEYSDIGFILLGLALEVLSGQRLARFCSREIFEPLRMTNTCFCPPHTSLDSIAPTENDTTFRHRVIHGEVHDENCSVLGGAAGHAGVFSDVSGLLRFAACILEDGAGLFRPQTVDLFATCQPSPASSSRALGWDTPSGASASGHSFSTESIGHLGFTGTSLWIDRKRQLAVVLLTNRTWPNRSRAPETKELIRRARPRFHDAILAALQVS